MAGGVYEIRNLSNGHRYIGSAVNMRARWNEHRRLLRAGKHGNRHLQSAWARYGPEAFRFAILEECEPEELIATEQSWMDAFPPQYNLCPTAGSHLGMRQTEATKAKIGAANKIALKGKKVSTEHRVHLSAALKGRKLTPEHCAKLSAANIGKKMSPEACAKMSTNHMGQIAWNKDKKLPPLSAERRAKIGTAQTGHTVSQETRDKIGAAHKGKKRGPHTADWKAKISAMNTGKTMSVEACAKMSASQLARRVRERNVGA